ncbi:hypothetical protein [Nocardia seriolae]|uniref:hypothetical protein n=1 Tax=Nocardia seriolae TaxID=37332 RepID=UPI0011609200|nr:hypothetical protein [Nocardia seriolae]MTJ88896.1 hypothetical protein [Nocardia seriolae]QUN22022.1 hypothetical protein KEC46_36395 [Nocardia seriolae]WKY56596.1 hypothetical protein Q5P07_20525 [Nocardia seriolae]
MPLAYRHHRRGCSGVAAPRIPPNHLTTTRRYSERLNEPAAPDYYKFVANGQADGTPIKVGTPMDVTYVGPQFDDESWGYSGIMGVIELRSPGNRDPFKTWDLSYEPGTYEIDDYDDTGTSGRWLADYVDGAQKTDYLSLGVKKDQFAFEKAYPDKASDHKDAR